MMTSEVVRLIIFIFKIKNSKHAKINITERFIPVLWEYHESTAYER
jgi:hypothetical protein